MTALQIKVNGQSHAVGVLPDTPLLWVLRDNLRLMGTKFGCGTLPPGSPAGSNGPISVGSN
jgi:isoquinoline 1-oxidoreductase alpha subunit